MTNVIPLAASTPTVTGDGYAEGDNLAFSAGTPWEGVLMVEGVETGDGRMFSEASVTWDTPPLPLRWNMEDSHGGEPRTKAVLVGRIDAIWRDADVPTIIRGAGVLDDTGVNGAEALRLIQSKFLKGVSVDPDSIKDADVELIFPKSEDAPNEAASEDDILMEMFSPPELTIFHAGRLRAATLVDIPAFVEAKIWLVDPNTVPQQSMVASGHFATLSDRPWNAAATEALIAAMPAYANMRSAYAHVGYDGAKTSARFLHHEAASDGVAGFANISACTAGIRAINAGRADGMTEVDRHAAYDHMAAHLRASGIVVPPYVPGPSVITASAEVLEGPPADWFMTPEPDSYAALTVTDEMTAAGWRRVYGHGAAWETCHLSFGEDACTVPPREPHGEHAYFRLGEVVCADGSRVAVGTVTLGTGHASTTRGLTATQAAEHYDNTGTMVALVASSEGKHGIWLSGVIPPWVSPERVATLQAAGQVSGDWRRIGGKLRLVAFLAVNHPGFPVPRLTTFISNGRQMSLVAAGMKHGAPPAWTPGRDPGADAAMARIARSLGRDPATRMNKIRARVKGTP